MHAHTHDNPEQENTNTANRVSRGSLPSLTEWLTDVRELSQREQRRAVKAALPDLATHPDDVRERWRAAIVDAGIYTATGLARIERDAVARATPTADPPAHGARPAETASHGAPSEPSVTPSREGTGTPSGAGQTSGNGGERPGTGQDGGQRRVPGSTWSYTPGIGVWNSGGDQVLMWCPAVTQHLISLRADGQTGAGQHVTISVPPYEATVPMADVEAGTVWLDSFPNAPGTADRKLRDAITNIVRAEAADLPATVAHPRWTDAGQLELPPSSCLPAGYLDRAGTWHEWTQLVRMSMDTPQIALLMGLVVAGLFVEPLDLASYVVHLVGPSSRGKSTAGAVAAGIIGDPRKNKVVAPWDVSSKGLPAMLRSLRVLPAFRDELEQAGFQSAELRQTVFRATEGAQRQVSAKDGTYRSPIAGWNGCLVSTGNKSILGQIDSEAAYARVLELWTPFTDNERQADALKRMAFANYGHGLSAILQRGITPGEWSQWLDHARRDLNLPTGDVIGRAADHLVGGLAGARLLGQLCGIDGYDEPVITAIHATLSQIQDDLATNGTTPGYRLLNAVSEMMAARPDQFPSRKEYAAMIANQIRMPETLGWDLTEDEHPGDVAVTNRGLKTISNDAELTDTTVALKQLDREGKIHRNEKGRDLARQIKVNGKNQRSYVLSGLQDDPQQDGNDTEQASVTTSVTTPSSPSDLRSNGSNDKSEQDPRGGAEVASSLSACVACGQPTAVWRGGEPRHFHPCPTVDAESDTHESNGGHEGESTGGGDSAGESATQRQNEPRPKGEPPAEQASSLLSAEDELASFQRWLTTAEFDLGSEGARSAISAFHEATGGLQWQRTPAKTGIALFYWLRSKHTNMHRPEPIKNDEANSMIMGGMVKHNFDYLHPEIAPELGQKVTGYDVNKQFLAAAAAAVLGTGEPTVIPSPRSGIEPYRKRPGYVEIESLECDHPAFRGVLPGHLLPMPMVDYLLSLDGVSLRVSRVIYWEQHARHLKAHADVLRQALAATAHGTDTDSRVVNRAVKEIYSSFYAGMLRSETNNNTGSRRPDWSDQVVALAWANALRGLDKAAQPPMGICRDTAWWVAGHAPYAPDGLEISEQNGKWKLEKLAAVTDGMIQAHRNLAPYAMRDAVNAANTDRINLED